MGKKVVITDYQYKDIDTERRIIEKMQDLSWRIIRERMTSS